MIIKNATILDFTHFAFYALHGIVSPDDREALGHIFLEFLKTFFKVQSDDLASLAVLSVSIEETLRRKTVAGLQALCWLIQWHCYHFKPQSYFSSSHNEE